MTKAFPAFERIDNDLPVEEETLPDYKAEDYYPVKFGQVFNDRYSVIGKMGYGSASTVWLSRDLQKPDDYVALKVYVRSLRVPREFPIYQHINKLNLRSNHDGRNHVRKLLGAFKVEGPYGRHLCLVHEPLGLSLGEIRDEETGGVLSAALVKEMFRWVLRGLEFLHDEAHVIHADLQASNMLMGVHDNSLFEKFERYEAESPAPRKDVGDRTIYISRPMSFSNGLPAISDLSEARFGDVTNSDLIMPNVYRAPEVILEMDWSYPVDIWGLAMVVSFHISMCHTWISLADLSQIWDLFEGNRLISGYNGRFSEQHHLAHMVAILGPPPLDFLQRSEKSRTFWDAEGTSRMPRIERCSQVDQWTGKWICKVPIPDVSLGSREHRLEGGEKELFLTFLRKMLQWEPEKRASLDDIYWSEWLLADLME